MVSGIYNSLISPVVSELQEVNPNTHPKSQIFCTSEDRGRKRGGNSRPSRMPDGTYPAVFCLLDNPICCLARQGWGSWPQTSRLTNARQPNLPVSLFCYFRPPCLQQDTDNMSSKLVSGSSLNLACQPVILSQVPQPTLWTLWALWTVKSVGESD